MSNAPKRFIIIAGARTGSTFLKNMINSHPDVLCFGEVLNLSKIQWDFEDLNSQFNTPELREFRDNNPVNFVDYVYDLGRESEMECVGFKSLYRHYRYSPKHDQLIQYLLENEDIRIIHLKRLNSFKVFCSLQIANMRVERGTTMNAYRPDDVEENLSITVNPKSCLEYVKKSAINMAKFDALFAHRKPLTVHYEDLSANTAKTMAGVLRFLDLKPAPLSINTHKVRKQPISEVVTNYDEVAEFMTAKGYGAMFA